MDKERYMAGYRASKKALCLTCLAGPECFLSHFDSKLCPVVIPNKV